MSNMTYCISIIESKEMLRTILIKQAMLPSLYPALNNVIINLDLQDSGQFWLNVLQDYLTSQI